MTLHARPITEPERVAFEALARRRGDLFQQPEWVESFGAQVLRCGIFGSDGALVGGFHVARQRHFGLVVARGVPFTPSIGPFLDEKAVTRESRQQEGRRAVEAVAAFLDASGFAVVFVSLSPEIRDALPFLWRGFKVSPSFTYRLNLGADVDLLAALSSRQRNAVKKARKDGLAARVGLEADVVGELQDVALRRKGKAVDRAFLDGILGYGRRTGRGFTVTVRAGDVPLAGAFVAHDHRVAYYILGGRTDASEGQAAGTLALFEAIEEARRRGLEVFDFEGSILPGIEQFVRGFGGELTPYYTVAKAWLPIEMALKLRWRQYF